jgi:branched-chain amino acid transport system ATP-binding protein
MTALAQNTLHDEGATGGATPSEVPAKSVGSERESRNNFQEGTILAVDGLRTGFGIHTILHGVSLEARTGDITAILGLNGAGKSVTLKTISGLLPAWGGSIHFKGEDITELETEDRVARGMAHVLQGRAVFPHLTIEENLRLGGAVVRDRAKVAAGLERVYTTFPRLAERRTQLGGTLSGGEQEMLAVGRALMSSPKLILVDEASQGLAPIAVEHLFETLKGVNESGVTLLMVEQNVSFTLGIADRVLVMQKGEIVYQGESSELDRDRLADLLGIGALLGSKVLDPEPPTIEEAFIETEEIDEYVTPEAKPRPRPKAKSVAKKRAVRTAPTPRRKTGEATRVSVTRARKGTVTPAKRTTAKRINVKRKPQPKTRTARKR